MTKVSFEGYYHKTKSCFWSKNGISLIIGKRANPSNSTKTREFLLFKESNSTEKPKYLSSLYPTSDSNVFEIEHSSQWYEVQFKDNGIHIETKSK
jgi:hypothetical protein